MKTSLPRWLGRWWLLLLVSQPGLPAGEPPHPAPAGTVWIPGGTFSMGGVGESVKSDELPLHQVKVDGFYLDRTPVTNEQFTRFVEATQYVTVAERPLSAKTMPGLLPEFEGKTMSLCFQPPKGIKHSEECTQWWAPVVGADWRHPEGPASNLRGREQHPVVHVCYDDALAYCQWVGGRLPTEAEWEYAARGGREGQPYVWGAEKKPGGQWQANVWQGEFPVENRNEDTFATTSPVGSFPANGYGLVDMAGNVWQWTSDWYRPDAYTLQAQAHPGAASLNPHGPVDSLDPDEPGTPKKVTRGGSFLCSDNYCQGYRPSARMKTSVDTGLQNTGFRCVHIVQP